MYFSISISISKNWHSPLVFLYKLLYLYLTTRIRAHRGQHCVHVIVYDRDSSKKNNVRRRVAVFPCSWIVSHKYAFVSDRALSGQLSTKSHYSATLCHGGIQPLFQ